MKLINENILRLVPKSELNGCGPKGVGKFVRDRWGKVSFQKAGDIHDGMYFIIKCTYPKFDEKNSYTISYTLLSKVARSFYFSLSTKKTAIRHANKVFYENLKLINRESSPTRLGYFCRKPVVWAYYKAVVNFGRYFV